MKIEIRQEQTNSGEMRQLQQLEMQLACYNQDHAGDGFMVKGNGKTQINMNNGCYINYRKAAAE